MHPRRDGHILVLRERAIKTNKRKVSFFPQNFAFQFLFVCWQTMATAAMKGMSIVGFSGAGY
jgi:hypothetical protein